MKNFKRVFVTLLALIMVLSTVVLAGCGKKSDPVTTDPVFDPDKNKPAEGVTDEGDSKIYIWSWNDEIQNMMNDYYFVDHPEMKDKVEFVNIASSGDNTLYQQRLDLALQNGGSDAPDIFLMEADYIKKYVNSDNTLAVGDIGISSDEYADQYQYTIDLATSDQGVVKGLSWQATPGAFAYRRSLAEKYLGTSDPVEVQKFVKDWDTFLDTARKLNNDSNGDVKMLSGIDDVLRVYLNSREQGWVVDGKLVLDPNVDKFLDFARTLESEGLINGTRQWTEAWNANMGKDNTFGFFFSTWGIQWSLVGSSGGSQPGEGTYGDWALIEGPQSYFWGGTWLGVSKYCDNKASVADIIRYFTTNKDSMKKYCLGSKDYVNNKTAIKEIIDEGQTFDFLGGQPHYEIFANAADNVEVKTLTAYDQHIITAFHEQEQAYAAGEIDKETAISNFKAAVADLFPDITVD